MPAKATLIRSCPASGRGTGRCSWRSTSGPPGPIIDMAVIVVGSIAFPFHPSLVTKTYLKNEKKDSATETHGNTQKLQKANQPINDYEHFKPSVLSMFSV